MRYIINYAWKLKIWKDDHGQDLVEYSLMAGFVAVTAGALMPGVASMISQIFSKVGVTASKAATQGS
jgi:pilus assembly protein Flp/PilA